MDGYAGYSVNSDCHGIDGHIEVAREAGKQEASRGRGLGCRELTILQGI